MADPQAPRAVKVGIVLSPQLDDVGAWLADGAAFDAAGADALLVDLAAQPHLDQLAVTAALAAVTYRSLLVTAVLESDWSSPTVARTLATIGILCRGRLRIIADAIPAEPGDASAIGVFQRIPGDAGVLECGRQPDDRERWVSARAPDSRATWRATVLDAAERGFQGLVVPAEPRLLDILRNPDDPGDRRDLQLAQG